MHMCESSFIHDDSSSMIIGILCQGPTENDAKCIYHLTGHSSWAKMLRCTYIDFSVIYFLQKALCGCVDKFTDEICLEVIENYMYILVCCKGVNSPL